MNRLAFLLCFSLLLLCSCQERTPCTAPFDSNGATHQLADPQPDIHDVSGYVKFTITSDGYLLQNDRFQKAREIWNRTERESAVRTALQFVRPYYSEAAVESASFFISLERENGCSQSRVWLREYIKRGSSIVNGARAGPLPGTPGVPELFDIYVSWLDKYSGLAEPIRAARPGYPELEWHIEDTAILLLAWRFRDHLPRYEAWSHYSISKENAQLQLEWRNELPKWLKAHSEARNYWIQECLRGMRKQVDLYRPTLPEAAENLNVAILRFEKEFSVELADRTGICSTPYESRTPMGGW